MVNLRPRNKDEDEQKKQPTKTPKKAISKKKGPSPKKKFDKPSTSDSERTPTDLEPTPKRPRTTKPTKRKLVVESDECSQGEVAGPRNKGDKQEESQSPAPSYDLSKGGEDLERAADEGERRVDLDDAGIDELLKSDFLRTGVEDGDGEKEEEDGDGEKEEEDGGKKNVEADDLSREKGEEVEGEADKTGESPRSSKRSRREAEDVILKSNFLKDREKRVKIDGEAVNNAGGNVEEEAGEEKEAAEGTSGLKLEEDQYEDVGHATFKSNVEGLFKTFLTNNEPFNGKITVRSSLARGMIQFKEVLKKLQVRRGFANSCFGPFLQLPEYPLFGTKLVHNLLMRRIICKKKKEVWISFNGLPARFGLSEFALMTGLNCGPYPSKEYMDKMNEKGKELWKFVVDYFQEKKRKEKEKEIKGKEEKKKEEKEKGSGKRKGKKKEEEPPSASPSPSPSPSPSKRKFNKPKKQKQPKKKQAVKSGDLLELVCSRTCPKKWYLNLCMAWFVHTILCARDSKYGIEEWVVCLSADLAAFQRYPWGRMSFELTMEYLIKPMEPRAEGSQTYNLYGFPWAFMAWAHEAIPALRPKDLPKEKTIPRIINRLTEICERDTDRLFDQQDVPVVHPFLIPTDEELDMDYFLDLMPFDDSEDDTIDRFCKVFEDACSIGLVGGTTICIFNNNPATPPRQVIEIKAMEAPETTMFGSDGEYKEEGIGGLQDVNIDIGNKGDGDVVRGEFEVAGITEVGIVKRSSNCRGCKCGECSGWREAMEQKILAYDQKMVAYDEKIVAYEKRMVAYEQQIVPYETKDGASEQIKGDSSGGDGFDIPKCSSCNCKECDDWRKGMVMEMAAVKETIEQLKRKTIVKPAKAVKSPQTEEEKKEEEVWPSLKVDIYKPLKRKKVMALTTFMKKRKKQKDVFLGMPMNYLDFKDLMDKTVWLWDIYVEAVLTMMRERHLNYPYHYDQSDLILDMAFLTMMKKRYYQLEKDAQDDKIPLDEALNAYKFDEEYLKYAHGELPYPGGRCWAGAKRIFAVFNINDNHYVLVVFDMVEAKVWVYDCNHGVNDDEKFLPIIVPILYMFPIYVRNSKLFKELDPMCNKGDMWLFERVPRSLCPQNLTGQSCGVFALMYIEHLITNTSMGKINDNEADRWRRRLAVYIYDGKMKP